MTRIDLSEPIMIGGVSRAAITLRKPKVRDLRAMEKKAGSDLEKTLFLIATLAELTPDEVDDIAAADLESIAKAVEGFTRTAQA